MKQSIQTPAVTPSVAISANFHSRMVTRHSASVQGTSLTTTGHTAWLRVETMKTATSVDSTAAEWWRTARFEYEHAPEQYYCTYCILSNFRKIFKHCKDLFNPYYSNKLKECLRLPMGSS
eukprot:GFUD01032944.1.p1 GENE.GFUD01032944.1~~GFUD01032944.1.p1  ORF type:complete len:120 (-),score=2.30 GFUD01032944.1:820-1179(-)